MTTTTALIHLPVAGPIDTAASPAERLLRAFLAGRSPQTLRAYKRDVEAFAAWSGAGSPEEATRLLLASPAGRVNEALLAWRAAMQGAGLAANTVNRKLAAVRSLMRLGRTLGMTATVPEVEGVKAQGYRDTRGCGKDGYRKLLAQLAGRTDRRAVRDRAVLHLLFDLALRRAEVCSLDLAHLDLTVGRLSILGKGRSQRETLTLPGPTRQALADWLAVRGDEPGPLFSGRNASTRLTGNGLWRMVRGLGERTGQTVRPHGLRHASITEALTRSGGDVRRVQKFSRHRSVQTVLTYDDARQDLAGEMAALVAGD